MRYFYISLLLYLSLPLYGQVQNPDIRFLWKIDVAVANFDTEVGEDEYSMLFSFSDGTNLGSTCVTFEGTDEGFYDGSSTAIFQSDWIFGSDFDMILSAWEDDGGARCEFDDGDDAGYLGVSSISGGTISDTGGPSRWLNNTGNAGSACVGDALIPLTDDWDYCYAIQWRHQAGNNADNPLIFNNNFSTGAKSHFNSNRDGASTVEYTNDFGDPSRDVFYSFQLSEDYADVTITTDFPDTDFDTRIYLINGGEVIDENDDIDGANNRRSRIQRSLCAGFYQVVVEGFDLSQGDFRISVDATGFVGALETSTTLVNATCSDATDGTVIAEAAFGVPPYTYQLVDAVNNMIIDFDGTFSGLTPNQNYYYRVTDACGATADSESFSVGVTDTIDPVAVCVGATITLNDDVVNSTFTPGEIQQLIGQSTDNCGIESGDIFPNTVSASDAPVFSYELIVYDSMGNSGSALCELNIDLVSGVQQNERLDAALTVYPNPTNGLLQLSIADHPIQSGSLSLRDQMGKLIVRRSINNAPANYTETIDLSRLPAGVYTLQLRIPEGQLTRRIVKQ